MCTEGQPGKEAARGWPSASMGRGRRKPTSQQLVSCSKPKLSQGPLLTLEFLSSLSEKRPTWASFLPCHFLVPLKALTEAPNRGAPAPCPFAVKLPDCRSDLGRSVWSWLLVVAAVCAPSCSSGWGLDMAFPGPDSTSCPLPLSREPCQKPTRLPREAGEEDPKKTQGNPRVTCPPRTPHVSFSTQLVTVPVLCRQLRLCLSFSRLLDIRFDQVYKHVQQRVEGRPVGSAPRPRELPSEAGWRSETVSHRQSHISGDLEGSRLAYGAQLFYCGYLLRGKGMFSGGYSQDPEGQFLP